jgi:dihydrodipicolinate synthase/N-acetylneuraminate lyase
MTARLRGIFPPIPTSFDSSGDVDTRAISANVTRWMTTRLSGVLALGSNGEASLLDESESDRVLAAARQAVPSSKLLIAGTGRESTRATIDACRRAAEIGADAVLVRPPAYYKNQMTNDALIDHYKRVADASPVPVLLYNLPATGVVLTLPVVAALAEHPNVAGMKETSPELERLGQFTAIRPTFAVLSGWAPVIYPAMGLGAAGGILAVANVLPDRCVDLYEHARAGRHEQALELQRAITPLAQMVSSVHGIAGLKVALTHLGFPVGPCRGPLQALPEAVRLTITRAVDALAN